MQQLIPNARKNKKLKVVTLGGGTGSYTLLSGLKNYSVEINAIVGMADDGGSTGRLRDELGVLPPGDVRQCLVALSGASRELRELMQYRFRAGDLKGHTFGNIFLSALEKTYGSMSNGLEEAQRILDVKGKVVPVTEGNMRIVATLANGETIHGEDALDCNETLRRKGVCLQELRLAQKVRATKAALSAVREADVLVIGPGDHFSNIVPSLLVGGFARAIQQSNTCVLYVANLTNKKGLTAGWKTADYVRDIERYVGRSRVNIVLYNTTPIPPHLVRRYEKQEGNGSVVQLGNVSKSCRVVTGDLLYNGAMKKASGDAIAHTRSFIRHDSEKLARVVMQCVDSKDGSVS